MKLSLRDEDRRYLDRRVDNARLSGETGANRSSEVRKALAESRQFRHDLRGAVNAVSLGWDLVKQCGYDVPEGREAIEEGLERLKTMLGSKTYAVPAFPASPVPRAS